MSEFKPMEVAFADRLRNPRVLVIEVKPQYKSSHYTAISTGGGDGYYPKTALRTKEEWLAWVERFSDDLTGRELREVKEAVQADFVEPDCWAGFRKRFAETGDPWLKV